MAPTQNRVLLRGASEVGSFCPTLFPAACCTYCLESSRHIWLSKTLKTIQAQWELLGTGQRRDVNRALLMHKVTLRVRAGTWPTEGTLVIQLLVLSSDFTHSSVHGQLLVSSCIQLCLYMPSAFTNIRCMGSSGMRIVAAEPGSPRQRGHIRILILLPLRNPNSLQLYQDSYSSYSPTTPILV